MGEGKELLPTVLWAQRKQMIIITVKYQPSDKPDFEIHEDYMKFKGVGVGLSGKATYKFDLVFYEPLESDKCRFKLSQSEVEFRLVKKRAGIWPRLQSSQEKPHWIGLNFNFWEYQSESDDESEDERREGPPDPEKIAKMEKARGQLDQLEKEMKEHEKKYNSIINVFEKLKTTYLLVYNGLQWSGFILIVLTLLKCLRGGMEGIQTAYENTVTMMMFCQLLMLLEIGHALFGLVKSGVFSAVLQVFGRFVVLFVVLVPAEEIHRHPVVFVLFLVWSLIEVIRYPYYILAVISMDVKVLNWLRYTAWIPLYPVGFLCEATTIYLSLEHFDNTDDFSLPLPNPLNISFHLSMVLRVVLFTVPLIAYNQIMYMIAQRRKKLGKVKVV